MYWFAETRTLKSGISVARVDSMRFFQKILWFRAIADASMVIRIVKDNNDGELGTYTLDKIEAKELRQWLDEKQKD